MKDVVIALVALVLPMWILFHYITRWIEMNKFSADKEISFGDLHKTAEKLEERLKTLERILDDEVPDWRSRNHDL